MGEINFFAPYILKEQKKQKARNRIKLGLLAVVLIAGGLSSGLFLADQKLKAEIRATENYLATPEIQEKIAKMETMKLRMETGAQYYQELLDTEARIEAVDFINVKFMDTLASTLPAGCTFTEMTLDVDTLEISGTALTNRNVAEIEYNLKKTGLFKDLNVSEITNENNARQFVLTAILR
jgi:Tfp pilus assembly protein PilN